MTTPAAKLLVCSPLRLEARAVRRGLAGAGEVLVSGTVFGTVVGGPFAFEDRGFHQLKGVPGHWPLFCLSAQAG